MSEAKPVPHKDAPGQAPPPAGRSLAASLVLVAMGLIAAVVGSQVIWETREIFQIPPERRPMVYTPELEREAFRNDLANRAIGFGTLGLLMCGGLGAGLGFFGGSVGRAVGGLVVGVLLGGLLGAGGGMAALALDKRFETMELDPLFKAMLLHLPNWLLLGIALAGTSVAALRPRPSWGQLLVGAVAVGVLAAVLYPLIALGGSLAADLVYPPALAIFPAFGADMPIPFNTATRLLCFGVGGVLLGWAAASWLGAADQARAATPAPE